MVPGLARPNVPEKKTLLWDHTPPGAAPRPPRTKPHGAGRYGAGRRQAPTAEPGNILRGHTGCISLRNADDLSANRNDYRHVPRLG